MTTKIKKEESGSTSDNSKGKFLKDKVASIIFTDDYTREYTEKVVSKALDIPLEVVKDNLKLVTPRVNSNVNVAYSYVDAVYENDTSLINIEINQFKESKDSFKNIKYVCNLILKQYKIGDKEVKLKPLYQINISNYDVFNAKKFMYKSVLMEESIHKKRHDFLTIVDINLDFLRKLDYTKLKEEEDSLEKLLYIFICNDEDILDKLYDKYEIMDKVRDKLSALTEDFLDGLYYNKEEYDNEMLYKEGFSDGVSQNKREIAKNLLNLNISDDDIMKATNITKEELQSLKD